MSVTVTVNGKAGPSVVATNGDTISAAVTKNAVVNVTASAAAAPGGTGPTGPQGPPSTTITVGNVSTLSAGSSATVVGTSSNNGANLTLAFGIPAGATGATGAAGTNGVTPTFTTSASTLSVGSSATVTTTTTNGGANVALAFGIPRGADGAAGSGGGASLSDATPSALGTAAAGTSSTASRSDHVHAVPTINYANLTNVPSTFVPSTHTHAVSDVSGLQTALDSKQAAGTYATLVGGTVPSSQLPSYVDDVIEYANLAAFTEQSTGKIFVARDTGKIYRWSGSAYIEISPSPGTTTDVPEGANLYFTTARAAAAAPVQSVAGRTGTVTLTKSDVDLSNVPNTDATARANHTGSQAISTVTGLQAALDAKQATISSYVASVSGRTGTVTLTSTDVGLANVPNVDATARANHTGSQAISTVTGLQDALDGKQAAGTYATLVSGTVPSSQLPSYVDDVIEYANLAAFTEQSTGKIFVARDTGKIYRWSGSTYIEISPSPGSTDSVTEGSTNLYFTTKRAADAAPVQSVNNLTGALTLAAGSNVTLTASGSTITISSTGGSDVDGGDYTGTLIYDRTIEIKQQPTDQIAVSGAATISVTATVSPYGTPAYQWQRFQSSAWTNVTGGNSSSLALTGLTNANNGDRYRCVISAQSAASVTSDEALLGVNPTVPGAPTSLSAVRGSSSITLSWTPPSNGGSAITDYVIQYAAAGGSNWTTFSDGTSVATSATLTGLTVGTFYQLRVAAKNSAGQGDYSTLGSTVKFGPAFLQVSDNSYNATVSGLGDSSTPLVITRATSSQNSGRVAVKTANTTGTETVGWYMTVTGGPVRVYSDSGTSVVVTDTMSASTQLSPSQELVLTTDGVPFSFTFTAQR